MRVRMFFLLLAAADRCTWDVVMVLAEELGAIMS